ncbi:MAG: undecaprenyl-phosphate glucose phosphotransferase [Nitrospinae bacterium]|nr:undecaprenyl-phosphate glucose phosphotransferase [Nitrospinota bacterium]
MLKKYGQLFISALFVSDTLVISISWVAAYYLRFNEFVPVSQGVPPFAQYIGFLVPIWIVFLFNIKACGLYEPLSGRSYLTEYYNIVKVCSLSVLMVAAISFFYRGASYSRAVVIVFWALVTVSMVVSHALVRRGLMALRKKGVNLSNVLIVGAGDLGQLVAEKIDLHPEIGFHVAGYLSAHPEKVGKEFKKHKVLGLVQDVSKNIREHKINQLIVALPLKAQDRLEEVLKSLGEETVDIKVVPDLLRFMNVQSGVDDFDGLPVVNLNGTPLYGWNLLIKRATDLAVSALAIVLTSPVMLLVAALIKLESRGPVIFRQERVGMDGNAFPMIKFRSMYVDAEDKTGPVWARKDDDRCTRVGRFIRRTSLDELPQLFNVLKGDMSLVGPRPERPVFVEDFKKTVPHYVLRLKMKAGLTGWAQIHGWRGNTSLQKRIEYDLYYIKNWSLLLDFKILVMTLWKGFVNRHAY